MNSNTHYDTRVSYMWYLSTAKNWAASVRFGHDLSNSLIFAYNLYARVDRFSNFTCILGHTNFQRYIRTYHHTYFVSLQPPTHLLTSHHIPSPAPTSPKQKRQPSLTIQSSLTADLYHHHRSQDTPSPQHLLP